MGHTFSPHDTSGYYYDLDKINDAKAYNWKEYVWYGETKSANILMARGLQKKFEEAGKTSAHVNSCHPGVISTSLGNNAAFMGRILNKISSYFIIGPEKGAVTQTYLASSPEVEEKNYKGEYFVPYAKLSEASKPTQDKGLQEKLWNWSVEVLKSKGFEV